MYALRTYFLTSYREFLVEGKNRLLSQSDRQPIFGSYSHFCAVISLDHYEKKNGCQSGELVFSRFGVEQ